MLTDQIFELWNIDAAMIVREITDRIGPCDLFLGGSLADDLGTRRSDVDVYCFSSENDRSHEFPVMVTCGEATLELHIINTGELKESESLKTLLTTDPPPPAHRWPLLSPQRFRQMHALYRDRPLRSGPVAESARQMLAPDLLHIYVALRSTLTAGALATDLLALDGPEHELPRLYCARLLAESSLDAALAVHELVNPNPKWRLLLAHKAFFTSGDFPRSRDLIKGLFPAVEDVTSSIAQSLQIAASCLLTVSRDRILTSFSSVTESIDLVTAAIEGQGLALR